MSENEIATYDFTDVVSSINTGYTIRSQGSEAKLYYGLFLGRRPSIMKERFIKKYRHPTLDKTLSVERMRQEVRLLTRCKEIGVKCPTVYFVDMNERCIVMQHIHDSVTVKDFIFDLKKTDECESHRNLENLGLKIGANLASMHKNDIIHGDLTTSNMMLHRAERKSILSSGDFSLYFIDFGLSKKGALAEDKAVDLYVLERAILSSHPEADQFYKTILEAYFEQVGKASASIASKLKEVQQRGRKRSMLG